MPNRLDLDRLSGRNLEEQIRDSNRMCCDGPRVRRLLVVRKGPIKNGYNLRVNNSLEMGQRVLPAIRPPHRTVYGHDTNRHLCGEG